jgi:DNA-binding protein HU-beta
MNKSDIGDRLAGWLGLSKAVAKDAVEGVFEAIVEAMANGEEVRLAGFGTFAAKNRAARTGRNPQTGEVLSIPASKTPSFKAGKALKDAVKDG